MRHNFNNYIPKNRYLSGYFIIWKTKEFEHQTFNRYRRKRPKVDASIFDSALSHTRRSAASEKKEKKIACPLLDVFACGQVSSPRLYRLTIWKWRLNFVILEHFEKNRWKIFHVLQPLCSNLSSSKLFYFYIIYIIFL